MAAQRLGAKKIEKMVIDRRSGRDRRSAARFRVNINAEWEGAGQSFPGTINDISTKGCFVVSSGDIANGSPVRVFFVLKNGVRLPFAGEVVNPVFEIGFGMKFTDLTPEQKDFLNRLIKNLKKRNGGRISRNSPKKN